MAFYPAFVSFLIYFIVDFSACFNIDDKFPLVFEGPKNSFFGYVVEFYRNQDGPVALITAPKANSSNESSTHQPGVLYTCNIMSLRYQEVPISDSAFAIPGSNAEHISPLRDDMLLGFSLDIEPKQDGNIVTCGHLWKNRVTRKDYFANGACYVINSTFHIVHHLFPLVEESKQSISEISFYGQGMAGFSVSYTMDGEDILVGSPGVYAGKGSVVNYNILKMVRGEYKPIIPNPQDNNILEDDAYVGYSVTSGRFGGYGNRSIAAGAPRCKDCGCVYIFKEINDENRKLTIQERKSGEKMGDYFGATVLGVNINNDEYTDLLVGAPFYSTKHSGDKGRVYVYMGSETGLNEVVGKLEGSRHPNARFGSAISAVGDLNLDGFTDIAVGAPYEEGAGAVYIFHGSQKGVVKQYVQRITPSDIKMNAMGFGISISKGMDIDDNGYPDILVGAYDTSNAVLLRSRPIIQVYPELKFDTKLVKINSATCNVNGKEESCFTVKYCFRYSGMSVPKKVDLKVNLTVDVYQRYHRPRCYFLEENQHVLTIFPEITIYQDVENCYGREVYIRENIKDFLTPIQFNLMHELKSPQSSEFCKTCPIIDPNKRKLIMREIMFLTECRSDNECLSDLKLHIAFNIGIGKPLIVGVGTVLVIDITIENAGDPAFQTELNINLSGSIEIINQADCTSEKEPKIIALNCKGDNPLYSDQPVKLQLKLDTSKVPGSLKELQFEFWATTTSTEINPADNNVTRTFPVVVKPAILIKGLANNEFIFITDKSEGLTTIKHTYLVSKNMPKPISMADITLSIPIMLPSSEMPFLEINNFTIENIASYNISKEDSVQFDNLSCPEDLQEIGDSIPLDHPADYGLDNVTLDCSNVVCKTFKCVAGPFTNKRKSVVFQIVGTINFTLLEEQLGKLNRTVFVSEGMAEIRDMFSTIEPSQRKSFATVTKILERKNLPTSTPENNWWIIPVSVLSSIILLIPIILLLRKFGFLRRNEREEMGRMAREGQFEMEEMAHEGRLKMEDADEGEIAESSV